MKKRVHALAAVYAIAASALLSIALAGPAIAADRTSVVPSARPVAAEPIGTVPVAAPLTGATALLAVEQPADPQKKDNIKEPVATGPAETPGLLLLVVGLGAILASIVLVVRASARRTARNV